MPSSLSELSATQKPKDHLDIQYITKHMANLEQLHLCYRSIARLLAVILVVYALLELIIVG